MSIWLIVSVINNQQNRQTNKTDRQTNKKNCTGLLLPINECLTDRDRPNRQTETKIPSSPCTAGPSSFCHEVAANRSLMWPVTKRIMENRPTPKIQRKLPPWRSTTLLPSLRKLRRRFQNQKTRMMMTRILSNRSISFR